MPRWNKPKTITLSLIGLLSLGLASVAVGCTGVSNGVRWVREAPLPDGWPTLTPVGEVEVKDYPATRAAIVTQTPFPDSDPAASDTTAAENHDAMTATDQNPADDTPQRDMDSMFMTLFKHIKSNEIAMTAPVDMGYREADPTQPDAAPEQVSMAFLYRHTEQGTAGPDGEVTVTDAPARTYASIGVRGKYTDERFAEHLKTLDDWLAEHADTWTPDGPPRYLGYNSPFIPGFIRYGEVQRPVKPAAR